ncbi:MAG: alkaline phosphatase family protein [Planctomycetes bacterium]|nr:alkaline phosphatase family protein [Planctomycetota bacterium]MBI3848298.1 alkaline phosphatase family protein [Planctomycetota bacterium]
MRQCTCLVSAFILVSISVGNAVAATPSHPKVIVLGFDGVDHGLCEKYMAEGRLPNLQKLRDRGTFLPLATTNPAQSPVAWAALTTGSNPGKTNIYDFLESKRVAGLPPIPDIALVTPSTQHALDNDNVRHLLLTRIAVALVGWILLGLLLKILRVRWLFAIGIPTVLLGVVLAVGYVVVKRFLPDDVPMAINARHGTPFWSVVGRGGLRATVLEAPVSFPPDKVDGVRLLSGLGVPDVAKTWGFWSYFTSDPNAKLTTETGGWIYPLRPKNGVATVFVHGPEDIFAKDRTATLVEESRTAKTRKEQIPIERDLESVLTAWFDPMVDMVNACDLEEVFRTKAAGDLVRDREALREVGSGEAVKGMEFSQILVPMRFDIDAAARAMKVTVQGKTTPVKLGEWSRDWITVDYRMNPMLHVVGMAKIYLQQIEPHVEIVMTPIQFHPGELPPIVDLTYPHDFSSELCKEMEGPFETLGWATMTNPAKDDRLDDDGFIRQTWGVFHTVEKLSLAELEKRNWDAFFTLFAVTDRMQHIMFRMIDPKNPLYEPELAKKYGDEILKMYQGMDTFVGQVADRFVDEDTLLLVVSDHGFKSFRRGVNLNSWLRDGGYLSGGSSQAQDINQLQKGQAGFANVNWKTTKAYALGLGGIYINRASHQGIGIVEDKDYDALCEEIVVKLRTLKDDDGTAVVKDVYKQKDLYHGDQLARAPDLVVGFQEGYRVSWQSTLGNTSEKVIENNDQRWSGDHCSIDPSLLPGILFSNRRLPKERANLLDIAPTVCDYLGVAPDMSWDGHSLIATRMNATSTPKAPHDGH